MLMKMTARVPRAGRAQEALMNKGLTGVFHTSSQVLCKIAADLCGRYADADAEVFLFRRANTAAQAHKGKLPEVLLPFVRFCHEFPHVQVIYQPQHPYGVVCRTACSCQILDSPCRTWCQTAQERPNAMVLLTRANGEDIAIGGRGTPPQ